MNSATQVIDQDGHMHVFFIAQEARSFSLLAHGAVRRDDLTGMGLANVNEEKFDVVTAEAIIQLVDAANSAGRHGAGGRTEDQQDILLITEVAQTDGFALERDSLEVRGALTRHRAGK